MALTARTTAITGTTTGTSASVAPGYPSGTAANDLILEAFNINAAATITAAVTNGPANTTKVDAQIAGTSNAQSNVWEGPAFTADLTTGPTFTPSAARAVAAAVIAVPAGGYESITDGTQVTAISATLPSVTPTKDNSMLVAIVCTANNTVNQAYTITTPTGWALNGHWQTTSTTGVRIGLDIYTKTLTGGAGSASGTTTITGSVSTLRWVTSVVVVKPVQKIDKWSGAAWVAQRVDKYNGSVWVPQLIDKY